MANKITIIGAGQVGSTVAYSLSLKQLASEIVIIDIIKEKAMGEAMDIRQGTPFVGPVSIRDGDYEDARDSDIVIFTSGVGRKPGQSRLDLTQTNVNITKSVIPLITKVAPNALYVIVANPVDILTYQFVKTSGIPANHIFGTGTMLDTARFRARIAETYKVGATNVHGYVFGEHGDSSFVPWSLANIGSIPVDNFAKSFTGGKLPEFDKNDVEDYIRKSGGIIINAKKFTNYGIAVTTANLVEALNYDTDSVLTITSMMNGEYGISDVCLSIPTIIGCNGIKGHIAAPLPEDEVAKLRHSADCLKDVIKQIEF
ncbi:MAG: L-lactate dehydrogenase [Treponema sp.]|nr:L-lactate dehydrogenase [Treponema sp.]